MNTQKKFFGHPIGLSTLFATEFWERFSYYGMRALLTLYLTATLLDGGFGMDRADALSIYGLFTGLVYITPIFGGLLADKVLGQQKSIYIGALVMAFGQLMMAYSSWYHGANFEYRQQLLYLGLGTLIIGNGFFKPNISTMVGGLYSQDSKDKDSGFTIFYMGINLGAFLAPLIAGQLGEKAGWHWGFLTAGIGMLIGTIWFYFRAHTLGSVGLPPDKTGIETHRSIRSKDWRDIAIWTIGTILITYSVIFVWSSINETIQDTLMWIVAIGGVLYIGGSIYKNTEGKTEWSRVWVILILAVFNIVFWSGYEQAGGTFNLFARDHTNRHLFGTDVAASLFQGVSALSILIFAPLFTVLWSKLSEKHINPRTPYKFGWGLALLGLGFVVMGMANDRAETGVLVGPMWLIMVYVIHTWGELFISPIGLSMITKLSPAKIVSAMMGIWMGSIAIGNYLAAMMDSIVKKFELPLFYFIAGEAFVVAIIAFLISPFLVKMMKGIH